MDTEPDGDHEPADTHAISDDALSHCAAYVASRAALEALCRTTTRWPETLAHEARLAGLEMVRAVAVGVGHAWGSAARRRCARTAMASALQVAALCDVAQATGVEDVALDDAHRATSRAIGVLALFFHAHAG
jgi:hypothetical protein